MPFPPNQSNPEHVEPENQTKTKNIAWRVFFTTRQIMINPENWVAGLASPGDTKLTARQFLLGTQKNRQNACVAWRQFITRQAVSEKIPRNAKFNKNRH